MASIRPEQETCPCCNRKGDCRIHAYYDRYLIDYFDETVEENVVRVLRLICSCGATHAVLPDPIIPYSTFSLFFILQVLKDRFCHFMTIDNICQKYGISPTAYYRFLKLFERHRRYYFGEMVSSEKGIGSTIKEIEVRNPFSSFASDFFLRTSMTFLQHHKNPASYQRNLRKDKFILQ